MSGPSLRVGLAVESEGEEPHSVFRRSSLSHSYCGLLFLLGIGEFGPLAESNQTKPNQNPQSNTEHSNELKQ